mmetsp:Transcript_44858/g.116156  ORF Transcript_44858/g.116156 Transcript_44858/m.116156 type:complete len:217 (-) Transcript_44858:113-763(-)
MPSRTSWLASAPPPSRPSLSRSAAITPAASTTACPIAPYASSSAAASLAARSRCSVWLAARALRRFPSLEAISRWEAICCAKRSAASTRFCWVLAREPPTLWLVAAAASSTCRHHCGYSASTASKYCFLAVSTWARLARSSALFACARISTAASLASCTSRALRCRAASDATRWRSCRAATSLAQRTPPETNGARDSTIRRRSCTCSSCRVTSEVR